MYGHFKYPNNPRNAPSALTIMSIRSNERNGIKYCKDSKTMPARIPKSKKFDQIREFRKEI